jgi:uncharacterized lipoprotein YajG
LKGGTLPTYRNWKNETQRKTPVLNDQYISSIPYINTTVAATPPPQPAIVVPPMPLPQMNPIYQSPNIPIENTKSELDKEIERQRARMEMKQIMQKTKPEKMPKLKYLKQKRTLKRTYHVGKSKVIPKVSVLVSNKTIRNNISTKKQLLNQVPIEEIRKFLLKKGFIKVGSTSPNDVLRKMYESVVMISGDVTNHNPENLLYNFFNDVKN